MAHISFSSILFNPPDLEKGGEFQIWHFLAYYLRLRLHGSRAKTCGSKLCVLPPVYTIVHQSYVDHPIVLIARFSIFLLHP